jgi:glycosyltransferase involved in cell wall biosynthesis
MRIVLAHNHYLVRGGEDESCEAEALLLRAHGDEVVEYFQDNRRINKLGKFSSAGRTIWSFETYREVVELLQSQSFDLVYVQNFFPLISPSIFYAAKKMHVPVIWTLRNYRSFCLNGLCYRQGDICEKCLGKWFPWPGVRYSCYRGSRAGSGVVALMLGFHRLIRTWSRKVDAFMALTDFARQKYIQAGLPAQKIFVKPNFVIPDPGIGAGDGKYALFVGRLNEEKGVPLLLDAWQRLKIPIPLWIVGDGPLTEEVQRAAVSNALIKYCGRLPHENTLQLMQSAVLLVFPSCWYEGMPRTLIEAFATGLPVVCNDLGAMHSMVVDGKNGLFFEEHSASDLALKVDFLYNHPESVAEMRHWARQSYEKDYTAQLSYRRWMEIVTAITGRNEGLDSNRTS